MGGGGGGGGGGGALGLEGALAPKYYYSRYPPYLTLGDYSIS